MIEFLLVLLAAALLACVHLARSLARSKRKAREMHQEMVLAEREARSARAQSVEDRQLAKGERDKCIRAEVRSRERSIRAAVLTQWAFELHPRQLLVYIPGVGVALDRKPGPGRIIDLNARVLSNREGALLRGEKQPDWDRTIATQRCAFQVFPIVCPRLDNRSIYALIVDEDGIEAFAREIETLAARGDLCPM